jgi:hypothetical protein
LVPQAALLDCLFNLLSRLEDLRAPAVANISGRQIDEALVVSAVVLVVDEGADLLLKVAGYGL